MADQKPPRLVADELTTVQELLQYQRESLVRKVTGVTEADARRSPVASGTTLLWLMKHISVAERVWVITRFAGLEDSRPADEVGPDDTMAAAVEFYRQTWSEVDGIVGRAANLDEPSRLADAFTPTVNLRWILMHLLEETARHAGHADILRELIDGSTGR